MKQKLGFIERVDKCLSTTVKDSEEGPQGGCLMCEPNVRASEPCEPCDSCDPGCEPCESPFKREN